MTVKAIHSSPSCTVHVLTLKTPVTIKTLWPSIYCRLELVLCGLSTISNPSRSTLLPVSFVMNVLNRRGDVSH